ncbi:MAG TPA: LytR family transcriptional regulator, partial [Chloroflexi bacterium]|nr:LytR family transcriptional regulator [Chloroflexota bacterium]
MLRAQYTVTLTMVDPTSADRNPWATISTSGSSGIMRPLYVRTIHLSKEVDSPPSRCYNPSLHILTSRSFMTENLSLSIHLQDTRPTHRISQTTPPIPISRRRSCLPRLLMIFLLLLGFVGGLMAGGFVLWRWSATLPRTNLLLLGLDRRPEEGDTVRSDSMILVGLDPQGPHVALLSIPRDLYVQIPGHGTNRINSAHFWGE